MLPAISLIVMAEIIIPHTHAARQAQEFGIISRTMPQNKSTSRIAAITGKLVVTFAALLAPAILIAETTNVTFNAALTNAMGWTYSDKILFSNEGGEHPYFRTIDSYIESQQFNFNVTSITIRLSCTSTNATRHLHIGPTSDIGQQTTNVAGKDKQESQTFLFDAASNMRSFLILLKGSSTTGNWHLYSAAISGVPLVAPPADAQATDISGTRFALSWTNPENAVSNRITVSRIVQHEAEGTALAEYDFEKFSNSGGNPIDITGDFTNGIPAFAGSSLIYLPTNSEGIIQISSGKQQGSLICDFASSREALDEVANVSMLVSAKKHSTDVAGAWNLKATQFDDDDNTSHTTNVVLGSTFPLSPYTIQIKNPAACKSITLRPSDTTAGNRRILIDTIAFIRDYVPAYVETNIVRSIIVHATGTGAGTTIRSLAPNTDYLISISAFDAEGNESGPSEPLAVTTNDEAIPFSIRIQ